MIEQEIKQGKTFIKSKNPKDYLKAVFMVSKDVDVKDLEGQEQVLKKRYTFKIPQDKFGQAIEFLKSLSSGASVQTKNNE